MRPMEAMLHETELAATDKCSELRLVRKKTETTVAYLAYERYERFDVWEFVSGGRRDEASIGSFL